MYKALPFFILFCQSSFASPMVSDIDSYIAGLVEKEDFSGTVLIQHKDENILSKGYGMAVIEHQVSNQPHTAFRIGSISKSFAAALALIENR